ncbi:unnamed protein product [[Candida] boidinii]|uniref:Unnamed protein product n=1 Tax=Candida boidinii TaxID=5477 RepID=A0ACB5UB24_CANBO|nr:unnamed protein product [[Candida] boidinii]
MKKKSKSETDETKENVKKEEDSDTESESEDEPSEESSSESEESSSESDDEDVYEEEPTLDKSHRFNTGPRRNTTREIIIDEEYPIDNEYLNESVKTMRGIAGIQQMQQQAITTNNIINSRILRTKRVPNANALGYSNIRSKKPSYAL